MKELSTFEIKSVSGGSAVDFAGGLVVGGLAVGLLARAAAKAALGYFAGFAGKAPGPAPVKIWYDSSIN
jgi:hypothetical protein